MEKEQYTELEMETIFFTNEDVKTDSGVLETEIHQ